MVSINCLLFVSVEVRLFLEWFLSTLLRLFQPTISLRKMGLISKKIFPACESMCVCCPALRSSSRQPVKRYKKLLAEIFPKSLDGPPNERKIVKLCEYAAKNPVRTPKIAKYLEERCYKELRVEHIKFINIVWERFTRLAAEAEATKIERDNARRMETEALEREQIAKRRAEKYRVAAQTAEEKVHKFGIALITSWVMIGLYFVVLA